MMMRWWWWLLLLLLLLCTCRFGKKINRSLHGPVFSDVAWSSDDLALPNHFLSFCQPCPMPIVIYTLVQFSDCLHCVKFFLKYVTQWTLLLVTICNLTNHRTREAGNDVPLLATQWHHYGSRLIFSGLIWPSDISFQLAAVHECLQNV